jgi:hypothetical protein
MGLNSEELKYSIASAPDSLDVPNFWQFVENHPDLSIALTEGGKKALSLLSQGYIAMSIYGVNAGYSTKDRIAPALIPDLLRFCNGKRHWILTFDEDDKRETRRKVQAATAKLAKLLVAEGCQVSIACWEPKEGKGIDDAIAAAAHPQEWLESMISAAPSFQEWQKSERQARMKRVVRSLNCNHLTPECITTRKHMPKSQPLPPLQTGVIHVVQPIAPDAANPLDWGKIGSPLIASRAALPWCFIT